MRQMAEQGCQLIDLNMIEPFRLEDKKYQPSSLIFDLNQDMYAIRSDWTRSLLNYNESYFLDARKFCYFGPVIRDYRSFYQAGVELYQPASAEILQSLEIHLDFIRDEAEQKGDQLRSIVMNHDRLIDLYIKKYQLDQSIRPLIYDKNLSLLKSKLRSAHPLLRILSARPTEQFAILKAEFRGTKLRAKTEDLSCSNTRANQKNNQFPNEIVILEQIKEIAEQRSLDCLLDLSFRSPQTYYNGLYFQVFLNYHKPLLSGGEYGERAFGIALDIEEGGLL